MLLPRPKIPPQKTSVTETQSLTFTQQCSVPAWKVEGAKHPLHLHLSSRGNPGGRRVILGTATLSPIPDVTLWTSEHIGAPSGAGTSQLGEGESTQLSPNDL